VAAKLWAEQNGRAEEEETQGCRGERDVPYKKQLASFPKKRSDDLCFVKTMK
jgi:hypothetical protein